MSARLAPTVIESFAANGTVFDLAAPMPQIICFREMGEVLAGINRFNGRGVSDAQHCTMGAQAILNEGGDELLAALFLLHDGHEYLIGDIIHPMEKLLSAMRPDADLRSAVQQIKAHWDVAIYTAAGLPTPDAWRPAWAKAVAAMDARMLRYEAISGFGPEAGKHLPRSKLPTFPTSLKRWPAGKAEEEFRKMAYRLIGEGRIVSQAAVAAAARALR